MKVMSEFPLGAKEKNELLKIISNFENKVFIVFVLFVFLWLPFAIYLYITSLREQD
jgi:hypothetical protein